MARSTRENIPVDDAWQNLAADVVADAVLTIRGEKELQYGFGTTSGVWLSKELAGLEDLLWLLHPSKGQLFLEALGIEDTFDFIIGVLLAKNRGKTTPLPKRQAERADGSRGYTAYYDG